jgi:hypothetical protein
MRINRSLYEPEVFRSIINHMKTEMETAFYEEIRDFCTALRACDHDFYDKYRWHPNVSLRIGGHTEDIMDEPMTFETFTKLSVWMDNSIVVLRTINKYNPLTDRQVKYLKSLFSSILRCDGPRDFKRQFEPLYQRFQEIVDTYETFKSRDYKSLDSSLV